jgi:cobalt-zinc-cadmium resistance protein CzcA
MTGSLIYAALIAPAMAFGLMCPGKSVRQKESAMTRLIASCAAFFVRFRAGAVVLASILLIIGGFAGSQLGSEFTPELEEGDILLRVTMAPSISLTQAEATVTRIEQQLAIEFPEIDTIVTRVGRGEVGAMTDPTNSAEIFLSMKSESEWRAGMSSKGLRYELSEFLESYPGILANVGQPIAMAVDELLTGTRAQLAIKIFGPDSDQLISSSNELQQLLRKVPGAADVQAEQLTGAPELKVTVDRDAIGRFGLNIKDTLETLRTSVGGTEAGALFEGVRQFPIIIRLNEQSRSDPAAIGRILLKSKEGALVPLREVAKIETVIGPRQITREDGQRFIAVQANVRGRDIGSFVAEAQTLTDNQLKLPPGYSLVWGGQFELQQKANARFAVVIPITLAIVFFILLTTFGRVKSAVLILLNIPLALTGGALALWITGLPVSVPATVGFIALFGIALGNGMVLVSFMDDFARAGRDRDTLAVDAARLRARPVMMTAMTTALGLAPLLFASGVGAEVQRPLATVVIGGLITSTVLTLLVLPALHRWFAPKPDGHHSLVESKHVEA